MAQASALDTTSLSELERRVVSRFAETVQDELGADLHGAWLYGSRARGEPRKEESDVDLLVITRAGTDHRQRLYRLLDDVAMAEGASPPFFSVHVHDETWLAQRGEIRSFYIAEVDRDKVVLAGEP
ncbi:MAG: nucleotidyltransferase domain-containing protein [Actinobacteria bacterium]|nr:MAG: nucleotidyltransferase domain-containing protein [Actinomycetota bacterium]